MTSRETGFTTKDEGSTGRIPKWQSSSRPWSTLKDPRIVRVSRSFGGKDRHSKVCTVKGLRDRRVRLSVQTAIQLYDLQDRLGLSQPSKVVDWLLNVAQHDIDKLPPLQMPIENFVHYAQSMVVSNAITPSQAASCSNFVGNAGHVKTISTGPQSLAHKANYMRSTTDNNVVGEDQASLVNPARWNFDATLRAKCKEVGRETMSEKNTWIKRNDEESQQGPEFHGAQVTLLNNVMPYASYYHWESPSNPCHISHLGGIGYSSQAEETHKFHTTALPSSSLSLPSGSPMLFCPSSVMPPIFSPYLSASTDYDLKQINHFQMLNSNPQNLMPNSIPTPFYPFSTPTVRPLQLNITTKHLQSENDQGSQSENSQQG